MSGERISGIREPVPKRKGKGAIQGPRKRRKLMATEFVVAIDFGATFSGVAFSRRADLGYRGSHAVRSHAVHCLNNWPGRYEAGMQNYCKTQTSAWYVPVPGSSPESFELKGWGWQGFVARTKEMQRILSQNRTGPGSSSDMQTNNAADKIGHFLTKFRLDLAGENHVLEGFGENHVPEGFSLKREIHVPEGFGENYVPEGLGLRRVVTDYLRELVAVTMDHIRKRYRMNVRKNNVQFVFTMPSVWDDRARQTMEECAQMAGLVQGPFCTDRTRASHYDVIIVSEAEAAAMYVYKTRGICEKGDAMYVYKTRGICEKGDRFMVVDIGGSATDIVVHEKVGATTTLSIKVEEVAAAYSRPVGGSHVDDQFFNYLRKTIGCFSTFESENPISAIEITRCWEHIKSRFGSDDSDIFGCDPEFQFELCLPAPLGEAWKAFLKRTGQKCRAQYHSLTISFSTMEKFFAPTVDQIVFRILQQGKKVQNLKAILVVGGFSKSPYLRKKIQAELCSRVDEIIFPVNPASVVVEGAVAFGMRTERRSMLMSAQTNRIDIPIGQAAGGPSGAQKKKHPRNHIGILENKDSTNRCRGSGMKAGASGGQKKKHPRKHIGILENKDSTNRGPGSGMKAGASGGQKKKHPRKHIGIFENKDSTNRGPGSGMKAGASAGQKKKHPRNHIGILEKKDSRSGCPGSGMKELFNQKPSSIPNGNQNAKQMHCGVELIVLDSDSDSDEQKQRHGIGNEVIVSGEEVILSDNENQMHCSGDEVIVVPDSVAGIALVVVLECD